MSRDPSEACHAVPCTPGLPETLGVIMLDTRFPRVPGDIGNPQSFDIPVRYEVVKQATVARVVRPHTPQASLREPFLRAARRLADAGVCAITTSCGFLSPYQNALQQAVAVPVLASSLCRIPALQASLPPGRRVGVITIHAERLSSHHLRMAGADPATPWVGTQAGTELTRVVLEDLPRLDTRAAEADVLEAAASLLEKAPDVGAILLECANMAPYAPALHKHVGLPVHDIVSFARELHREARRRPTRAGRAVYRARRPRL